MKSEKTQEKKVNKVNLTPELFDMFAPPVYRKILKIVKEGPIAERIFEKVFVSAFTNNKSFPLRSPLMSLIDIADEKSNKTIQALEIFNECCSGSTISIAEKK